LATNPHNVISLKTEIFIINIVRISKLAQSERCSITSIPLQRKKNAFLPPKVKNHRTFIYAVAEERNLFKSKQHNAEVRKRNISHCVK
jgi:hypothetical protein